MGIDQRSLLIAVTAACGLVMVVGAFGLLYRGIIKLEPPSNAKPTELELLKVLKLKTNVAALVLFVLGFAFLSLGFQYVAGEPPHFQITGRIIGIKSDLTESVVVLVCGGPWPVQVQSDGTFYHPIKPDLDQYGVMVGLVGGRLGQQKTVGKTKPLGPTYGFVPISKDLVADVGDIPLEASELHLRPAPVDRVTDKPAPAFNYGPQ